MSSQVLCLIPGLRVSHVNMFSLSGELMHMKLPEALMITNQFKQCMGMKLMQLICHRVAGIFAECPSFVSAVIHFKVTFLYPRCFLIF